VCADLTFLLRARIEGWFKKPRVEGTKKRKIKEVLKKILAPHHHRRNLVFLLMSAGSHFFPYFVPLNYLDILIIKKYCGQITQNQK